MWLCATLCEDAGELHLSLNFFLKLLEIRFFFFSHKFPGDYPNLDTP